MSISLSATPQTPATLNQILSTSNVNHIKAATPDIILFEDNTDLKKTIIAKSGVVIYENNKNEFLKFISKWIIFAL